MAIKDKRIKRPSYKKLRTAAVTKVRIAFMQIASVKGILTADLDEATRKSIATTLRAAADGLNDAAVFFERDPRSFEKERNAEGERVPV